MHARNYTVRICQNMLASLNNSVCVLHPQRQESAEVVEAYPNMLHEDHR